MDLTVGTPDMDIGATPVSSHTASRDPGRLGSSFESQPEGGRHLESQTQPGPLKRYGTNLRSTPTDLSGTYAWGVWSVWWCWARGNDQTEEPVLRVKAGHAGKADEAER